MRSTFNLISFLGSLPFYAIAITAIVVAVARWQRHPNVSMFVTIGACIQVVARLSYLVVNPLLLSSGELRDALPLASAGIGVISSIGYALIVAAVFVGRSTGTEAPAPRW